jgi:hypothetical protein
MGYGMPRRPRRPFYNLEKAAVSDELIGVSDPKIAIVDRDRENVPKKKSK